MFKLEKMFQYICIIFNSILCAKFIPYFSQTIHHNLYVWHSFFTDTSDKPSMLYIHIIYLWHYHFTNTYDKQSMYTPHCCSPDKYNYCIHRQRERTVLGNSIARCKSNQVILSMKFKCISMFKLRTLFYINLNTQKTLAIFPNRNIICNQNQHFLFCI